MIDFPTTNIIIGFLVILTAYLLGSVSTAIITCQLLGYPDPRSGGSGNPGATNVLRTSGKKAAVITLVGDCLKGFVAVKISQLLTLPEHWVHLAGFSVFLGHIYPLFFGLKGGKGVATYFGILIALNLQLSLVAVGIWIACQIIFERAALSSIITACFIALFAYLFFTAQCLIILCLSGLLILRHHSNIRRRFN